MLLGRNLVFCIFHGFNIFHKSSLFIIFTSVCEKFLKELVNLDNTMFFNTVHFLSSGGFGQIRFPLNNDSKMDRFLSTI